MLRIVGGLARGCRLERPSSLSTRPATDRMRESLFAILEPHIEGVDVLDLFAGSGVLGLEALSRGAAECTFVEWDKKALGVIERNVRTVGYPRRCSVLAQDVSRRIRLPRPAGLVFLDPPFPYYRKPKEFAQLEHLLNDVTNRLTAPESLVIVRFEDKAGKEAEALLSPVADRLWREETYGRSRVMMLRMPGVPES